MTSYESFKMVFASFEKNSYSLNLKVFNLEESASLVHVGKLVESYSATFTSDKRELEFWATSKNIDCFVRNIVEKKSFPISDLLLNSGRHEIKKHGGENEYQFYSRALGQYEEIFKLELAEVLLGKSWVDVPKNWRGYK